MEYKIENMLKNKILEDLSRHCEYDVTDSYRAEKRNQS